MPSDLKCTRIDKNSPPMPSTEIEKMLNEIPGWNFIKGALERIFHFNNFQEAIQFINKIADLAISEGHHPDLTINYDKVTVDLSTHKINGISINEFIMASKISLL
jgi:4a-hydroxytetrahydrobiopterin dehydratase